MTENMTIGGIWKNKRNGKLYKLVASNGGLNRVQICPVDTDSDENGYNCMTPHSLRKNYSLQEIKKEEKVEPNKEDGTGRRQAKRIEMPDGRVITGTEFLRVAGKTVEETAKGASVPYWLSNVKDGQALLASFGGKIVEGKPLTK